MGLLTKTKLGCLYDLSDYTVRTWHIDRTDHHAENTENCISEKCEIGRNHRDSNPDLIFHIYENREWNPNTSTWNPDGRYVLDFVWPFDSDANGNDIKECSVEPEDLKKLADFICSFLENKNNSWGTKNTTQTQVNNQYNFNSTYPFNYYVDDKVKNTEKMNFDFVINKFDYGMEGFEAFTVKMQSYQLAKQIDQFADIIMTPVQLKEFADFINKAIS